MAHYTASHHHTSQGLGEWVRNEAAVLPLELRHGMRALLSEPQMQVHGTQVAWMLEAVMRLLGQGPAVDQTIIDYVLGMQDTGAGGGPMLEGTFVRKNEEKGFGFIQCDDFQGVDVFVHRTDAELLQIGQRVRFQASYNNQGKPQARNVMADSSAPPAGVPVIPPGGAMTQWAGSAPIGGGRGAPVGLPAGMMQPGMDGAPGTKRRRVEQNLDPGPYVGKFARQHASGYGFVECPEVKAKYGNDVFVQKTDVEALNQTAIMAGRQLVGQTLRFGLLVKDDNKLQACDLSFV